MHYPVIILTLNFLELLNESADSIPQIAEKHQWSLYKKIPNQTKPKKGKKKQPKMKTNPKTFPLHLHKVLPL